MNTEYSPWLDGHYILKMHTGQKIIYLDISLSYYPITTCSVVVLYPAILVDRDVAILYYICFVLASSSIAAHLRLLDPNYLIEAWMFHLAEVYIIDDLIEVRLAFPINSYIYIHLRAHQIYI